MLYFIYFLPFLVNKDYHYSSSHRLFFDELFMIFAVFMHVKYNYIKFIPVFVVLLLQKLVTSVCLWYLFFTL